MMMTAIDSCTVNPIGRLTMLGMLAKAIKGTHVTSRHVTMRKSQRIVVQADQPLPIHIDGEIFAYPRDNVRQITVTSLPQALQVVEIGGGVFCPSAIYTLPYF
jgi:diacylglycerol kinase family enzyme